MNLDEAMAMIGDAARSGSALGAEISAMAYDSRSVAPGALFFCLRGRVHDGHDFHAEAAAAGAVALVCERPLSSGLPELVVGDSRAAMNRMAPAFFGFPSREVKVAGVTGTNGKTTTCYLLESIFRAAGMGAGLIGTIESRWTPPGGQGAAQSEPSARTTPESVDLQRLLASMRGGGVRFCALEATSIGIAQGRMEGTQLEAAVFTNLTQDHLDYHGTIEAYFQAKRALFSGAGTRQAVVNADDPHGRRLAEELGGGVIAFGVENGDVRAAGIRSSPHGLHFQIEGGNLDGSRISIALPGLFNVSNAMGAALAADAMGIPPAAITGGIAALKGVPGRFEPVERGQDFTVVVDYSHTPDALGRAIGAARQIATGRVLLVFGCGGDRDRAKRPMMGAAAGGAAKAWATSDNPRGEDPAQILAEIEGGLAASPPALGYELIVDRRAAITAAISEAASGDVVLIAGKGHETYQEAQGIRVPFDDRLVAAEALEQRR